MRTSELIKSKYWRAIDLENQAPIVLTIADVTEEAVGGRGQRAESKFFLWFMESLKGLQLNKTRVKILEAAYGLDTEAWINRRVQLYFDPTVEFGGRRCGGIGIRTSSAGAPRPAAPPGGAAWGAPAAPPGAPPAPVWNAATNTWDVQQPAPRRPPPPVWNKATNRWDVVDPGTGEVAPAAAPARHVPPPTISQRTNAEFPAGAPPSTGEFGGYDQMPPAETGEDPEFGHPPLDF